MKKFISLVCALALIAGCMGGALPTAKAAAADGVTYYVSTSGKGGNSGLTEAAPLPGLDAVPWDQLLAGDSVLLKKGDTFPGSIRMVDVHGEEGNPITIGTYGTGAAPVIEARGQGIWLPETGNDNGATPGKYASAGVLLYDCSYITVSGLEIVNVPDALKTSFQDKAGASDALGVSDHSAVKMPCAGVAVAADDVGAALGIVLENITVRGDADVQTVMTDTSTSISTTGVTKGATASSRTFTNASGTYYVSSLNGSDANDGSSPDKAFYSLHKINELNLKPGAKVYLENGSVFENQYLHIEGSGADGNPVIIDAYGSSNAPKPLINTNGNGVWYQNFRQNLDNSRHLRQGYTSSSILIYDVEYVEVKNIAMTNFGRYGETPGADFENLGSYDGGTVPGETGYNGTGQNGEGNKIGCYQWGGKMARTGVAGVSQNVGTMDHVYLQNLDIENVYGNVIYKHMDNGGIYFTIAYALDEATTGIPKIDDLRIEGCYLKRVSRWGIAAAYTGAYSGMFGSAAISDETCQKYGVTNLYIGHNYLEEVGGDPITTMYAYEPLIEYNVAFHGGREMSNSSTARYMNTAVFQGNTGDVSAGIWPWKCKTALFEHNECYTMMYGDKGGNGDCQAWDADYGDSTTYQYNYSSGNTGGCVMFCYGQAYNTVFRYNISYKDGVSSSGGNNQGVLDIVNSANGQITQNTFIMAQGTPANRPGHSGPAYIENNIFYNLGSAYDPDWNRNASLSYNNNLYVGFSTSPTDDSSVITAEKDALFADTTFAGAPEAPATIDKAGLNYTENGIRNWARDWDTSFNMFKLKDTTNAAVNAGVPHNYNGLTQDADFGVPRVDNDKDFYSNALDDVHDIGAHDTQTDGGELPVESGNELIASLYELRDTTNLQVPFTTNNPLTVEEFAKGLTVSDGAHVEVYDGTTKKADTDNVAADMTVKIVAGDGTESETVYTIKNKNVYNHSSDWINNQQGNVWFCQYRLLSDQKFYNWSGWTAYGSGGWYEGSNNATAEPDLAGDDLASNPANRKYIGSGFTFRAPQTGKVTIHFATQPKFRTDRNTSKDNQFDTYMIIYRNGVQIDGQKTLVPKAVEGESSRATANIEDFDLTVLRGDTIEFMVVNEGDTRSFSSNNNGVTFNPVVTYIDEEVAEVPTDTKAPSTPSGLRAKNITEDSADLTWMASTDNVGVDHYVVTVGDDEYTTTDLTYALTGLEENTEYTVTVKAVDEAGNESGEAAATFRTAKAPDTQAPTAPTGGKTVSNTSKSATIAWTESTDNVGVDHYEVTVGDETVTVRNATQVTISGLEPSKTYTAKVVAFDAAGNYSAELSFTFQTAGPDTQKPTVPGNVRAILVGKHTATVRWDPSTDNEAMGGYKVRLGTDGEEQDVGNVLSYAVDGLEGYTDYTAYVCAYDAAGNQSNWASVAFQTTGSSECELISTLFEISSGELKIPYTEKNPLTLEEFRAAFEVSEDAAVKVYQGDAEVTTGNVTAGMTVKIVAQDGTINPTTYTTALKSSYNSFEDWGDGSQGNVWFYQYDNGTEVVNHSRKESWGWGGENPDYRSVEQNQACGDVTADKGSGFTFRAPADGNVTIQLFCYPSKTSTNHTENAVQKRDDTSSTSANSANTLLPYLAYYLNGQKVESKNVNLAKDTSVQTVNPVTCSLAQGDELSVFLCNGGTYDSSKGNNGLYFNPVVTYNDEVYTPLPKSVELDESEVTIFTNTSNQEKLPHTIQLTATVLPEDADQTVTWRSSNPQYATVDANGLVTAVADGTTNISVTSDKGWGSFTANCTVKVMTRMESITVKKDGVAIGDEPIKVYVNTGDADHPSHVELTTETVPANPTHPELNWTQPEGTEDMISLDQGTNSATVDIDAVGTEVDVGEVTVRVESAEHPEVYTDFTVQVVRYLDNDIFITGDVKVGSTLTASDVELVMTDEGKAGLQYQWYRGGVSEENKIDGATGKQYVVTEEDIGAILYVTADPAPETFYEGIREAQTDEAVAKMAGPAAPTGLVAVNCTDGDDGQITGLDADTIYEYKAATDGDDGWTQVDEGATTIDDLPAGNYQVRIAATDTQEAGKAATVTIMDAGVTAYTITADEVEGGVIELSASQAEEGTEITVTLTPDTGYKLVEDSLEITYIDGEGEEQTVTATDGVFEMPAGNVTITAQFAKKTFTITHDYVGNVTCSLPGDHQHTVEYGDTPTVTLTANEGYTMPGNMTVTYVDENGETKTFRGYEYSRSADDPDTATLKFTSGITADLTVTAVIPPKTFAVGYTLKNGLKAPTENAPRTVGYKAAYTGTLVAEDPTKFTLPLGITVTMDGEAFTDFEYNAETGIITIEEGKITGDLVITATGLDATVPVKPVTGVEVQKTLTVQVGKSQTLTATVKPADATDPSVVWQSADTSIAMVDENGVVTGVAEGETEITVTTVDGSFTAICKVTVQAAASKPSTTPVVTTPEPTTETKENEDGSVTTTVTEPDGTVTETTEKPDGSTEVVETKPDGTITETKTDAEGAKVEKVTDPEENVTIVATDPEGEKLAEVVIPAVIPEPETRFEDVPEGHWADKAIHQLATIEVVNGVGGNKYDMEGDMTRGALATVLHRLSNKPDAGEFTFDDVDDDAYYAEGVAWAEKTGVVKGFSSTEFRPEQTITREQLALMLMRYAKLLGMDTTADVKALDSFADGNTTHDWAAEGVAWCVQNGILQGKGANTLDPTANVTRAQVAVMIQRFIDLVK